MSCYVRRGDVPHKRHTQFHQPDGSLYRRRGRNTMIRRNFETFKDTVERELMRHPVEENHRDQVWHELRACYDSPPFEDDAFITAGVTMLDAVKTFWDGLYDARPQGAGTGVLATV